MIKRVFLFVILFCLSIFTSSQALEFEPPATNMIPPNGSIALTLTGGTGPYTWQVNGNGFYLDSSNSEEGSNVLYASPGCGPVQVTAIDGNGNQASIEFRSSNGQWEQISAETTPMDAAGGPMSYTPPLGCTKEKYEGKYKYKVGITIGCYLNLGIEPSCPISCDELGEINECHLPDYEPGTATNCFVYEWVCTGDSSPPPPGTGLGGGATGGGGGTTGGGGGATGGGGGTTGGGGGTTGGGGGGCKKNPGNVSNPITIYNGNKFEPQNDLGFPSPNQLQFRFNRYYNSQSEKTGPMGFGWSNSFAEDLSYVSYEEENYLMLTLATGREVYFTDDGTGRWSGAFKEQTYLMAETDGFTWHRNDGSRYHFSYLSDLQIGINGRLEWKEDSFGNRQLLAYDASDRLQSVTDESSQRILSFHYNAQNRLSYISGPVTSAVADGIWVEYQYDTNDNLESVTYADDSGFTYAYTDGRDVHNLTEKKDKLDHILATWTYDAFDRAVASTTRDGRGVSINYQGDTRVQVTDAEGFTRDYEIRRYDGVRRINRISGSGCATCGGQPVEYSYDADLRITQEKFANNSSRLYSSFDSNANPRTIGDYSVLYGTKYTYFTYHPITNQKLSRKKLSVIGTGDKETIWDYDNDGNAIPNENPTMLFNRLIERGFTHDNSGVVIPYEYVTTYTYNSKGQATHINGPLPGDQDIVVLTYDPITGDLLTKTFPLVGAVNYQYDDAGNITSLTDANNVVSTMNYDGRNRLLNITRNGKITSRTYTADGQLDTTTDAVGRTLVYGYTTNGLLEKITDPNGDYMFYAYDALGRRVESSIFSQGTLLKSYSGIDYGDPLVNPDLSPGKPWKILQRNQEDTGFLETVYTYDVMGNISSVVDAENNTISYDYDSYNRLSKVTQPGSVISTYYYDSHDNLRQVTNAIYKSTNYTYDDAGRLLKTISQDSGTTLYNYDENGNLRFKTDNGKSIEYRYDSLGRLIETIYTDPAQNVTLTYDSGAGSNLIGRLASMIDPSGATQFSYNAEGRLEMQTKTIDGIIYVTGYDYDDAGNLQSVTYPTGQTLEYVPSTTDSAKIASVILNPSGSNQTLASNIAYQSFGPMAGMTLGNNIAHSKTFDLNYQITGLLYANGNSLMQRSYTSNDIGNITDITDNLDVIRNQSFAYDDLNRLISASGVYGTVSYTYDKIGNRYSKNLNGQIDTYHYGYNTADEGFRLRSISGANPASFSYTPSGNTTTMGSQSFEYNDNNRIVVSKQNGVELSQYNYNANGQRAKKDDGSSNIFHYNQSGQLIAVTDGLGNLIKAYVWLHGQPLAQIGAGGEVYYYHNDHLGTPQKMTDSSGAVVWAADYLPFGQADVIVATVENNLRFKGQYFDQETGLHYNYHRYYDPDIGRYLRADPIGQLGGVNLYTYVFNNPVNYIDPTGEFGLPGAAGGAIGGIIGGGVVGGLTNGLEGIGPGAFWGGIIGGGVGAFTGPVGGGFVGTLGSALVGALLGELAGPTELDEPHGERCDEVGGPESELP